MKTYTGGCHCGVRDAHSVVVISRQHRLNSERIERASDFQDHIPIEDFQDHIPIECVLRIAIIRGRTAGSAFLVPLNGWGLCPGGRQMLCAIRRTTAR